MSDITSREEEPVTVTPVVNYDIVISYTRPYPVGAGVRYWFKSELKSKEASGEDVTATLLQAFRAFPAEPQEDLTKFLVAYDDAGKRVQEMRNKEGTESVWTSKNKQASLLHETLCTAAKLVQGEQDESSARSLDPRKLPKAQKEQGVSDFLEYTVEIVKETGPFAFLFDVQDDAASTDIRCKVIIGKKENADYVFFVTMKRPSDFDIENHANRYMLPPKQGRAGQLPTYETKYDTRYLVLKFNKYFLSAENIEIVDKDGVPHLTNGADTDTRYIIGYLDPLLKAEIYATVVAYCDGSLQD